MNARMPWILGLLLTLHAGLAAAQAAAPAETRALSTAQVRSLLSAPARALEGAQMLQGRFAQRRYLNELPAPLPSSGDFLFVRGLGIAWHTRVPFDSEFLLTADGMAQRDGGRLVLRLPADQQPALQVALRLFVALFSLDLDTLAENFNLSGQTTDAGWELLLEPRHAAMAEVFARAVVSGRDTVQRVALHDRNGDRSEIDILELHTQTAPDDEARRRFAPTR